jgi:hypothetical protein
MKAVELQEVSKGSRLILTPLSLSFSKKEQGQRREIPDEVPKNPFPRGGGGWCSTYYPVTYVLC